MTNQEFIIRAKHLVADYTNENLDKIYITKKTLADLQILPSEVYVVWMAKTLQNSKALLSTNVSDGMYYELTYDGDKQKIYFDAYKNLQNIEYGVH